MFKHHRSFSLALFLVACLFNTISYAHTVGVSQGKYQLLTNNEQTRIGAELFFARQELHSFINLDANSDGIITEPELNAKQQDLQKNIVDALHINADASLCKGKLNNVDLVEADGIRINAEFICAEATKQASIELHFLKNLARGHRHVITSTVNNEVSSHHVAYMGKSTFQLISEINNDQYDDDTASFFLFGFEHILTGYDHLLFLLGLILIEASFRQVFFAVTTFTFAHSITLGMSVLGIWIPSSGIIEPLIALSIIYVGIENCMVKNYNKRWLITFMFGLIHGFGFAGALQGIALSKEQLPWVLLNFNLGVEAGQIIIISMLFPLLICLRRRLWFKSRGIAVLNVGLVLIGSYWFLDRTSVLSI